MYSLAVPGALSLPAATPHLHALEDAVDDALGQAVMSLQSGVGVANDRVKTNGPEAPVVVGQFECDVVAQRPVGQEAPTTTQASWQEKQAQR